jgi:16S rRNA (cytosine1402-N4)-methyltransferase
MAKPYHVSVLINEVIYYLVPEPEGLYVDVTFGGGGHSRAILHKEPTCKVIAIDWDQEALALHEVVFKKEFGDRIAFVWGNFANLALLLHKQGIEKVNGIIADFGTSQHQIFSKRGFSFSLDSPLDMRMSPAHQKITAVHIVNKASERELVRIFKEYGQDPHARVIARAIVTQRKRERIITTRQLAELIEQYVPRCGARIHPATKVFQALRIAVNHELESIARFLAQTPQVLKSGGRLVCISFHSLEDRLVKQFLRDYRVKAGTPGFEVLTPHAVRAGEHELAHNPAARSATLRAAVYKKLEVGK